MTIASEIKLHFLNNFNDFRNAANNIEFDVENDGPMFFDENGYKRELEYLRRSYARQNIPRLIDVDDFYDRDNRQLTQAFCKAYTLFDICLDTSLSFDQFTNDDPLPMSFIKEYLRDCVQPSACYNSAIALFHQLVGGNNIQEFGDDTYPNRTSFKRAVRGDDGLIRAIEAANDGTAFCIYYAGHGFVLVKRNNRLEHLESLAHGASLMNSVLYDNHYDIDDATNALSLMCSIHHSNRDEGAEFFGWNASALWLDTRRNARRRREQNYPNVPMRWWQADLTNDWLNSMTGSIQQRLDFIVNNTNEINN